LNSARLFGDDEGTYNSQSWTLEVWNGSSYTAVFTDSACFGTQWFEETMDVTTSRIKVTINGTASGTEVFEVEIWGEPVTASTTGYDAWATDNSVDAGDLVNLLEYALDGDTTIYGDGAPTVVKNGDALEYSFKQRNDDTNLVYEVQICTDLTAGGWTNAGTVAEPVSTNGVYTDVRHTIQADQPQTYIRLKVENQ
jgi:hypothetical protein